MNTMTPLSETTKAYPQPNGWLGSRRTNIASVLLLLSSQILLSSDAAGNTITARSIDRADVADAVASAADGDTVVLPPGVAIWTNGVTITEKAITIQGAGWDKSIIVDELANRSTPVMKVVFTKLEGMFRLTGVQFQGGTTNVGMNAFGIVMITGSDREHGNSSWRVDNCFFNGVRGRPMNVYAWSGLIDSCVFDQKGAPGMSFDGRIPDASNKGHRSWATPVRWGTVDAGVYVENCQITNSVLRAITDGFAGARFVFRYNTCFNVAAENHGTESTGIFRGTRAMEVYGNTFNTDVVGEYAVLLRSGTALVFSNVVTGKFPGLLRMVNYRERDPYGPWGQANGTNVWDQNFPDLYASGVHSGSANSQVLVASGDWTPNQWVGYHVINTTTGKAGQVLSNTTDSIICYSALFSANRAVWNPSDTFEIRKINRSLDMPGTGLGTLLSGGANTPVQNATPIGWPNQADEPVRYWDNAGITAVTTSGYYTILPGRNYTNAPPVDYQPLPFPHPLASSEPVSQESTVIASPNNFRVLAEP